MSTPELKPCPFCGGDGHMKNEYDQDGTKWYFVECMDCRSRTQGNWTTECCGLFLQERRDEWNKRVDNAIEYIGSMLAAIESIQHKAETQRVWNGMGYTATNPVCADIIKICEQQISKAKAGSSCHPSDFKHCHKPDLIDDVCECVDECKYKAKAGAA